MCFAADMWLLFRDTFLIQVRNSLTYSVLLTVDGDLALFFQLLHLGPVVDTPTQGSCGAGFGLVMISTRWFEDGFL